MTTSRKVIRGILLAAAISACQAGAPTGDQKDDGTPDNSDIAEAISQLPDATVLLYSADGMPQFIVGDLGKVDPTQMDNALAADERIRPALTPLLKAFRLNNDDLVLRKVSTDDDGARHFRYAQKFNGTDVVGGDLVVHVDVKGGIFSANGTARGDISSELGANAVPVAMANARIAGDARFAGLAVTNSRSVYFQAEEGSLHKAYEQVVEGVRGQDPVRDRVYVDMTSGEILAVHPTIHSARNRAVYSANNGTSLPGTLKRAEGAAATSDIDVNAAYDNSGAVYDGYNYFFGRDSYNNAGAQLRSVVHYSNNYCNAFWDGTQMVYGDGSASQGCGPLARSTDVTAHELTHAVTEYESNLTYSGESGGLNESMSDMFGAFIEAFIDGGSTGTLEVNSGTFLIGDEVLPPFLRNMCDPAADGVSKDYWYSGIGSVDVHYSSGPQNLVFCLLTKGGTHPRGRTTTNVPAIGLEKAGRIMYKANADYLTSSSNYAAMRTAAIQAATALGYDQATIDAVGCAYAAIQVGTAPTSCGGSEPPPPTDGVLTNGTPVSGISDSTTGNFKFWKLDVPAGQSSVTFTISGGSGDADLYVNFGSKPTTSVYSCRPYLSGNSETCTFTPPSTGTYWVGLRAYAAYSGVTLTGTYSGTTGGDPYLTNGVPVTGLSGATSSTKYYRIAVPASKTLTVKISGGSGDADLYTRAGQRPTTSSYACRPYLNGNTETCTHSVTTAGDWYVMIRGFSTYSGLQIVASY